MFIDDGKEALLPGVQDEMHTVGHRAPKGASLSSTAGVAYKHSRSFSF
jgi:hypothetical protein